MHMYNVMIWVPGYHNNIMVLHVYNGIMINSLN